MVSHTSNNMMFSNMLTVTLKLLVHKLWNIFTDKGRILTVQL